MTYWRSSKKSVTLAAYQDILYCSRSISKHPKMSVENRAKLFAPFSALRGFDIPIKIKALSARILTERALSYQVFGTGASLSAWLGWTSKFSARNRFQVCCTIFRFSIHTSSSNALAQVYASCQSRLKEAFLFPYSFNRSTMQNVPGQFKSRIHMNSSNK